MDLVLRAPKSFSENNFMRTSLLDWETITYTRNCYSLQFPHLRAVFRNRPKSLSFRVYWPTDQRPEAPKKFVKNSTRTSLLSWITIMYTHTIFQAHFCIYRSLFRNCSNSSIFVCISHGYSAKSTLKFSHKTLWGPSYWIGEPSRILAPVFSRPFLNL